MPLFIGMLRHTNLPAKNVWLILIVLSFVHGLSAQSISQSLPREVRPTTKFLFYLHGGVVTGRGDGAINDAAPQWGPYQLNEILTSLAKQGFHVISEVRQAGVDDSFYVTKLVSQIDSLLDRTVPPENILVVGASAGGAIAISASAELRNSSLRFVILGACWPKTTHLGYEGIDFMGHFLSIIEATDPHGTCSRVFRGKHVSSFEEVKIKTGLSHGFLYRGLKAWIDPMVRWYEQTHPNKK